jgi:hypothetical protein
MEWRVTIELSCADGTRQTHDVARGGCADPHSTFDPLGLNAGRWQSSAGRRAAASGSGPGRGVLRAALLLLALPGPPSAEGHAQTAIELVVRHGRDASTAVQTLPMRGHGAVDTLSSIGTYARSVHPRIRADIGEDGGLAAVSPRPAVSVRVLPARC